MAEVLGVRPTRRVPGVEGHTSVRTDRPPALSLAGIR